VCRPTITANGSRLGDVADYSHKTPNEELPFKYTKNFQTKHFTRHIAKPMLQAAFLIFRLLNTQLA